MLRLSRQKARARFQDLFLYCQEASAAMADMPCSEDKSYFLLAAFGGFRGKNVQALHRWKMCSDELVLVGPGALRTCLELKGLHKSCMAHGRLSKQALFQAQEFLVNPFAPFER